MWNEPVLERAKALFAEHLSMTKIALELNREFRTSFTRNAVIGKLHRVGLRCNPNAKRARSTDTIRGVNFRMRQPRKRHRQVIGSPSCGVELKPAAIPVPIAPSLEFKVGFFELTARTCRFPLWGVDDPPLHEKFFCGATVSEGEPYCPFHHDHTHNGIPPR